jgi:predicted phosphodiesterase
LDQSTRTERWPARPVADAVRIGVIADAHANLAATRAIPDTLDQCHCTTIIHAGDAIGIGRHPAEVLSLLIERVVCCVMGNHDGFAFGLTSAHAVRMHKDALEHERWTQAQLSSAQRRRGVRGRTA